MFWDLFSNLLELNLLLYIFLSSYMGLFTCIFHEHFFCLLFWVVFLQFVPSLSFTLSCPKDSSQVSVSLRNILCFQNWVKEPSYLLSYNAVVFLSQHLPCSILLCGINFSLCNRQFLEARNHVFILTFLAPGSISGT